MSKYSLMFHRKDCMGCHACEVACKQEHELGIGPRLVRVFERAPDFFRFIVTIAPMHLVKNPVR